MAQSIETKKEVPKMIVIHTATQTIGKMIGSGAGLVRLDVADRRSVVLRGRWRFSGEEATFPKHECRFFLTRDAALKVLRQEDETD